MIDNNKNYVKEIITDLDKLSNRCDEVDVRKNNEAVRETVVELKQTLRESKTGVGLAAPQIGKKERIFVINFNGDIRTFINPIITQTKGMTINREGCLSLPGKEYLVPRYSQIEVMYQTPQGKSEARKMVGLAAYVFQHELDHLEGITIADIGLEVGEEFDNTTEEEREKIVEMFLESLDLKRKELQKEIEETPELKQTADAIDFMTKVQKGEVQVEVTQVDDKTNKEISDKVAAGLKEETSEN